MIILFNRTGNCAYSTIIMMHIKYYAYQMRGIVKLSNYLSPLYYNLLYYIGTVSKYKCIFDLIFQYN